MTEKELIYISAYLCNEYISVQGFIEYMEQRISVEERKKNCSSEEREAYKLCMDLYRECKGRVENLREKVYDKSICIIPDEYIYEAKYLDWIVKNNYADTLEEAIKIYEDMKEKGIIKNRQRKRIKTQIDCQKSTK